MVASNPAPTGAAAAVTVNAPVKEQRAAAETPAEAPTVKSSFSLAGWASSPAPGVTASPTNSSTQATVAAPVNSPAFADELGAQVAIWSRHGVQEAELRMNPAEMGPVQVRIQLDGQVAQVRFVAEQAPTREALQAALPQLAQALAAEGLQWGGGDVQPQLQHNTQQPMQHSAQQNMQQQGQQQAQQQGQQQAEGQRAGGGRRQWQSATELGNEARGAPKQPGQRVGLLDLYA
jgi:flagellar hook-length control protein FliK